MRYSASEECTVSQFRWDMFILCQANKSEALQCPNNSKRPNIGFGYKSLADSLCEFDREGQLPSIPSWLCLCDLDEGHGIEDALSVHSAKWHRSYRNMYNITKLKCLQKRRPLLTAKTVAGESPSILTIEHTDMDDTT